MAARICDSGGLYALALVACPAPLTVTPQDLKVQTRQGYFRQPATRKRVLWVLSWSFAPPSSKNFFLVPSLTVIG